MKYKKTLQKLKSSLAISICFLAFACTSSSGINVDFNFPAVQKQVLKNGLTLYFLKDKSLPFVTLQAVIEAGSAKDYKGKEGLSYLSFEMLKEGSTTKPGEQLQKAYSNLGTSLDVDIDRDLADLSTKALSKYSDQISALFVETLMRPQFGKSEFVKLQKKHIATLKRTAENPNAFVDWLFYKNLYGENHPYSYPTPGTIHGVRNISIKDVQNFYKSQVDPSKIQVALTGYFTESSKKILAARLGAMKKSSNKKMKTSKKSKTFHKIAPAPTKIVFVDRPGMAQAEVRLGYIGVSRSYSDYISLYVANSVIGGGSFSSRLMQEARVKRGLVYGIHSGFVGFKKPGPFLVAASTRHEKLTDLIQVIMQELESARLDGVTTQELKDQKSIIAGQYPRSLETNHYYINRVMKYNVFGFNENYIKTYLDQVFATDVNKANKLLHENFHNTHLVITILGSKSKLAPDFKQMGIPTKFISYKKTDFY